jgi:cephalosporin hydroxylase
MTRPDDFETRKAEKIRAQGADGALKDLSRQWMLATFKHSYTYHFSWMGRPIIQFPQDVLALQEILWNVKPDLVVETGIAHGGSLVFHASMLELIGGGGRVVGVDIDIREPNRRAIESHPMSRRISMIQGSSTDPGTVQKVRDLAAGAGRILVVLDSNHTHEHVLAELRAYSPLVRAGSYVVVCDTSIEDAPAELFRDRPWGPGNNPKTAVREFLRTTDRFEVDRELEDKLLITVCPEGYLRCLKD